MKIKDKMLLGLKPCDQTALAAYPQQIGYASHYFLGRYQLRSPKSFAVPLFKLFYPFLEAFQIPLPSQPGGLPWHLLSCSWRLRGTTRRIQVLEFTQLPKVLPDCLPL
jgi:hypothetical protein